MAEAAILERAGLDRSRLVSLRYFNLFRLILAGLFLVTGRGFGLGGEQPAVFAAVTVGYLAAVLALGFPDAARRLGLERVIVLQMVIDVAMLTLVMWASGGYRSGMPVLMMIVLAGLGVALDRIGFGSIAGIGSVILLLAMIAAAAGIVIAETGRDRPWAGPGRG